MDFQFVRDPITHQPIARLSMEQEALGQWLTEELAEDQVLLVELLRHAESVRQHKMVHWQHIGAESTLIMQEGGVELVPNHDGEIALTESESELSVTDWNSLTACGIEDFIHLLKAWQEYVIS
ncbi:YacL family protein [Corallincola platygyrae]|uniref:YacL family protein n=1 Tax=Corallincola platygyrae TaxID=1193278 RepID=A0ABW4XPE4_9GAMM